MKKIVSLLLVLITMLSLFSCATNKAGNQVSVTTVEQTKYPPYVGGNNGSGNKPNKTQPTTTEPPVTTTKPSTTKPSTTKPTTTPPQTEPIPSGTLAKFNLGIGTVLSGPYRFAAYSLTENKMYELESKSSASWDAAYPGHRVILDPLEYVLHKSEGDGIVDLSCTTKYGSAVIYTAGASGTANVVAKLTKLWNNGSSLDVYLMKGDGSVIASQKNVSVGGTAVSFRESVELTKGETVFILVKFSATNKVTGGQNMSLNTFNVYFTSHNVSTSFTKPTVYSNNNISYWATHSYDKVIVNNPKPTGTSNYTVSMAKAETEGCQLVVMNKATSGTFRGRLQLISSSIGSIGIDMYSLQYTQPWNGNTYTDACVPYDGEYIQINAKTPLPFLIEFTTSNATPEGDYTFVFAFSDSSSKTVAIFEVTVHVWGFSIPAEKTFRTAAGLNLWNAMVLEETGDDDESFVSIYREYYNFLIKHNLCPYDFVGGILSEYYAPPHLNSSAVNFIRVPCVGNDGNLLPDEDILKYYNMLKRNPNWLKKAVFYPFDEPDSIEDIATYNAMCEHLRKLCPEIPVIAPFYTNLKTGNGRDQVDAMYADSGIWCPKLALWDESESYTPFLDYTPSKTFDERMEEKRKSGVEIWSYVCNDPDNPYGQLFLNTEGCNQRLVFWQMEQRNINGFLYWGVNSWTDVRDRETFINPWESVNNYIKDGDGRPVCGEGILLYNGKAVGVYGPVASIRLKIVRDGLDDIELIRLAEKYVGKSWVDSQLNSATSSLTSFTSKDNFAAIRKAIGDALDKKI